MSSVGPRNRVALTGERKMKHLLGKSSLLLASGLLVAGTLQASTPLGSGFTYQGQLKKNASPVNGTANLRFSLWDAPSTSPGVGGTQIGNRQQLSSVPISNGVFTVTLNAAGEFGPSAFSGE